MSCPGKARWSCPGGGAGPGRPGNRQRAGGCGPWTARGPGPGTGRPAICGEVRQADLLHRVSRISRSGRENGSRPPCGEFRAGQSGGLTMQRRTVNEREARTQSERRPSHRLALATLSAAVAASFLGVAGTLLRAALGSVVSTMGTEITSTTSSVPRNVSGPRGRCCTTQPPDRERQHERPGGSGFLRKPARRSTRDRGTSEMSTRDLGNRDVAGQDPANQDTAVWDRRQYGTPRHIGETQTIPGFGTEWAGAANGGVSNGGSPNGARPTSRGDSNKTARIASSPTLDRLPRYSIRLEYEMSLMPRAAPFFFTTLLTTGGLKSLVALGVQISQRVVRDNPV